MKEKFSKMFSELEDLEQADINRETRGLSIELKLKYLDKYNEDKQKFIKLLKSVSREEKQELLTRLEIMKIPLTQFYDVSVENLKEMRGPRMSEDIFNKNISVIREEIESLYAEVKSLDEKSSSLDKKRISQVISQKIFNIKQQLRLLITHIQIPYQEQQIFELFLIIEKIERSLLYGGDRIKKYSDNWIHHCY